MCFDALGMAGSVAVLGQFRPDCVNAASNLRGTCVVMEAIDEKVTSRLLETIDTKGGPEVAEALTEFAVGATAGLASHVSKDKRTRLGQGKSFVTTKPELQDAYQAVRSAREDPCPTNLLLAMTELARLPDVTLHCREAWYEVVHSLQLIRYDPTLTAAEALERMRNRTRVAGRRPRDRVVSRPLLVKGLEYDHVVLLEPSRYTAQELYVALTRGSKSVTVLNESSVLSARKMAGP